MQPLLVDVEQPQLVSVVITAHNEGGEVRRTIESVQRNTECDYEILLVDDGSTDGCCDDLDLTNGRLIRHANRVGVACSRHEASCLARGEVLAFLDGHQRISAGCLERCAELALKKNAIVWPDVSGLDDEDGTIHGAYFVLCKKRGFFSAEWKTRRPRARVVSISSLRAPGYVVPREVYRKVHWIHGLRGWGGSEAAISLKAFFVGVDILHLCGPLAQHRFKKTFQYEVNWNDVWRNHALIARVCFEERTWYDYWLPEVFEPHLSEQTRLDLEADEIRVQHEEFMALKVRTDRDFWNALIFREVPAALR